MTSSTESSCPKCGAPIPEDAPQGLCPGCVLAGAATATLTSSAGRTPRPTVEEVAAQFPDLEIVELIGAGGMGAVYKVRQPKLDRFVALKILSHDLAADPAFAERFNREARVLARLNHPNIVTVFDFGTQGPFCYLLMEYVDGVNLRQAMHAGGFASGETLTLVQDICAALKFAHEEGILHRDIKPENVLIDSRGRVKIADFGIAKLVGEGERPDVTLTVQGAVLGSPHYMAPEQIETPGDVDQRADIYSLGVVFYELLTGELPLGRFAPPSERSPMDSRIDEVVMRALEKEREARFQSAGEVQTRVEEITRSQPEYSEESGAAATPPVPASIVPDSTSGTARFATASAILTGVSLLLAAAAVVLGIGAFSVMDRTMSEIPRQYMPLQLAGFAVVSILVVGVLALLGIILGAKALREVRESGGRKSGLGRAMVGTLSWPVLILIALAGLALLMLMRMVSFGMSPQLFIILVLVGGGLAVVLLVWMVARWARGGGHGVRSHGHPGKGRPIALILVIAAVAMLAPLGLLGAFIAMNLGVPDSGSDFTSGDPGPDRVSEGPETVPSISSSPDWIESVKKEAAEAQSAAEKESEDADEEPTID